MWKGAGSKWNRQNWKTSKKRDDKLHTLKKIKNTSFETCREFFETLRPILRWKRSRFEKLKTQVLKFVTSVLKSYIICQKSLIDLGEKWFQI